MRDLREIVGNIFFPCSRFCHQTEVEERVIHHKEGEPGRDHDANSNNILHRPQSGENEGRWRQYYASFTASLAMFAAGMGSGWASPMLILLKSDDSPVGKMTLKEMSYLETIPTFAGIFAIYFFGAIVDKFGRKITGHLVTIFSISGWMLLIFASNPYHLYVGRALTGISNVGGSMVGAIYISEVVHESRRGAMMSYLVFAGYLGSLLAFILGDELSYRWFNISCIIGPALFGFMFVPLPESPYFLNSKSKLDEARNSLLWFRSGNDLVANQELLSIKSLHEHYSAHASVLSVLRSRRTRKAIIILTFMFSFQQLGGSQIVQGYASVIFEDTGNAIPPNKCATILIAIKVASTYAGILLVDRVGRRILMMTTFPIMSMCLAIVSVFLYEKEFGYFNLDHLSWVPLVSLSSFCVAVSLGVGTLAEVIGNEVIPTEVKGVASMVSGTITLCAMMACLQAYPYIHDNIGMYANFAYPAAFNLVACFITYFLLPETKGKSLEEITILLDS